MYSLSIEKLIFGNKKGPIMDEFIVVNILTIPTHLELVDVRYHVERKRVSENVVLCSLSVELCTSALQEFLHALHSLVNICVFSGYAVERIVRILQAA
jgi:hypothetical protein